MKRNTSAIIFFSLFLISCAPPATPTPIQPPEAVPTPMVSSAGQFLATSQAARSQTSTATSANATVTSAAPNQTATRIAISTTATITPIPDPNLPCGGIMRERVYLFLNCDDIRRIRKEVVFGTEEVKRAWRDLRAEADRYRRNFPTQYDPAFTWFTLGWGSSYSPRILALVYLVTGETAYANDVARLLELVSRNTPPADHLTNYNANIGPDLYSSGGLAAHPRHSEHTYESLLFGYLAIRESRVLDDAKREYYDAFFVNQARLLMEAVQWYGWIEPDSSRNRNTPLAANAAAVTIALAFPENPSAMEIYKQARQEYDRRIRAWWLGDGGWGEHTDQYGFRTLEGLMVFAETLLKNRGENLYAVDFGGKTLHTYCEYFVKVLTPEGVWPAFNESSHFFADPGLFRLCSLRTGDETLAFAARKYLYDGYYLAYGRGSPYKYALFHLVAWADSSRTWQGREPNYTSLLLPTTGAAILRSGWSNWDQYLLLQFTGSQVHQEYSSGAIYLYDNGPWIVGNGYYAGYAPQQNTDQHSTLSLDNTNQTNTGGEVVAFSHLDQAAISSVTFRDYPNLQHTRTVLWAKPWHQWTVVDDADLTERSSGHTLQLRWFVRGDYLKGDDNLWSFARKNDSRVLSINLFPSFPSMPAQYSRISRSYDWEQWINNAVGIKMEVAPPQFPVRLVSVLTSAESSQSDARTTRIDDKMRTLITNETGSAKWTWILPKLPAAYAQVDDFFLEGKAGYLITESGSIQSYAVFEGKTLDYAQRSLVRTETELSAEADLTKGVITIDSPKATTLKLLWTRRVLSVVNERGAAIDYNFEGSTLTLKVDAGRHTLSLK